MRRGTATIKGYALVILKANICSILATRLKPSPMIRLSCGTQSAHIGLINRRRNISLLLAPLPGGRDWGKERSESP